MLKFIVRRLVAILLGLLVITAVLYGAIFLLATPEVRAELYMPPGGHNPQQDPEALRQRIIEEQGLDDPYPVQYARWLAHLVRGDWGWSPTLNDDVLDALLARTPATIELTLYTVLLLGPLSIAGGVIAGWKRGRWPDLCFRVIVFVVTAIPPFILALVLLAVFYVGLRWFPLGRLSLPDRMLIESEVFTSFTGLLTIDGLLNGRPGISLDALRRLVLPVITLSTIHWATVGRITRAAVIEEMGKDYVVAARGRGLPNRSVIWVHVLRNVAALALGSTALSTASIFTGIFVVEAIFEFPGIAGLVVRSMLPTPDAPMAVGFAVFSVVIVLLVMFAFDLLQALVDPRVREGILE